MKHELFVEAAKKLVLDYSNENLEGNYTLEDVYVVWSTKVLQNSKLLLSTAISDGMYYEATLNGDKKEIYLDAYKKQKNIHFNVEDL